MTFKDKMKTINRQVTAVFLALQDNRTPWYAKVVGFFALSYALSPVDLIPDFIPVLGYLDDVVIVPILVVLTRKLISNNVWEDCLTQVEDIWSEGKPKRWFYIIPIVITWIVGIIVVYGIIVSMTQEG